MAAGTAADCSNGRSSDRSKAGSDRSDDWYPSPRGHNRSHWPRGTRPVNPRPPIRRTRSACQPDMRALPHRSRSHDRRSRRADCSGTLEVPSGRVQPAIRARSSPRSDRINIAVGPADGRRVGNVDRGAVELPKGSHERVTRRRGDRYPTSMAAGQCTLTSMPRPAVA